MGLRLCSGFRATTPSSSTDNILLQIGKHTPIKRKEEDLIVLIFHKEPLGFVLTSAKSGCEAFVTHTAPRQNPVVNDGRLKFAKLLKVNERDVEYEPIAKIIKEILRAMEVPPMKLTFCAPDGLKHHEVPDDDAKQYLRTVPNI